MTSEVLAGGLKVGDVVYSTMSLSAGGKSIKPGDKGTVQGPCNDPSADKSAERVLVEFETGLRANMLASTDLRKHDRFKVRPAYIARAHVLQGPGRGRCVSILRLIVS